MDVEISFLGGYRRAVKEFDEYSPCGGASFTSNSRRSIVLGIQTVQYDPKRCIGYMAIATVLERCLGGIPR